jgi:hypothetical protein
MILRNIFLFFSLLSINSAQAEVIPKEYSQANSTSIYFEENRNEAASYYTITLFTDSLCKNQIVTKSITKNKIPVFYINNLNWNTTYYWQVKAFNKKATCISTNQTHRFDIIKLEHATFGQIKLKVNSKNEGNYSNDFICLDQARAIFDRQGNLVWKLPIIKGLVDSICRIRDMKLTSDNTLTFLTDKDACEIDFEGNVLWKAPQPFVFNGQKIEYHHEFLKDKHNNYYVLGRYQAYRKILDKIPDDVLNNQANILRTDTGVYNQTEIGIILKFNKEGKLVWHWDSNAYLKDIDLNYKKTQNSFPNFSSHSNAFSINEAGTYAYFGMRDFCRIVKIDMQTKQAVAAYGNKYPSGDVTFPDVFMNQHDARIMPNNKLLVFNNDDVNGGKTSSVLILRDNINKGDNAISWKFDIKFDTLTAGKAPSGGNVVELANKNLLVCAGTLNRVFEVTPSKKVVWDAFVVCRKTNDAIWQPFVQYRVCNINTLVFKHLFINNLQFNSQNKTIDFELYNTGNVVDAYKIEVIDVHDKLIYSINTCKIKAGSYQKKTIKLSEVTTKKIRIKITSISNQFVVSVKSVEVELPK